MPSTVIVALEACIGLLWHTTSLVSLSIVIMRYESILILIGMGCLMLVQNVAEDGVDEPQVKIL